LVRVGVGSPSTSQIILEVILIEVYLRSQRWRKKGGTSLQGTVFIGTEPVSLEETANRISGVARIEDIVDRIQKWNGFYSIVIESPKTLSLAVDRIRSMPLFFGWQDDRLYVSDDATWVHEKLGSPCLDEVSCQEFRLTGFVVGPYTLSPSVFQVQAGEAVCFHFDDQKSDWIVERRKYRQFRPHPEEGRSLEDWLELYDKVLVRCFERTLRYVGDRHIVVPLSSGYDSRLIALMFKRLGVNKLGTVSYGSSEHMRNDVPRKVASDMKVPWIWIEYTPESWVGLRDHFNRGHLFDQVSNLSSLGHIQDWPMLEAVCNNDLVSPSSIFIAGHAADPLAGSRVTLTPEVQIPLLPSDIDFIISILKSHYMLVSWPYSLEIMVNIFGSRIMQSIGSLNDFNSWSGAFDAYNENERQAKYIVNCLRSTEHWGFDWWMPFFDEEFFAFWESVPLELRLGERLHITYIDNLYRVMTGQNPPFRDKDWKYEPLNADRLRSSQRGISGLMRRLYYASSLAPLRRFRQRRLRFQYYSNEPMAWYSLFKCDKLREMDRLGITSIRSMLTYEYFERLSSMCAQS
jgi:asparagine synthase (glutamine-hydrolysing)